MHTRLSLSLLALMTLSAPLRAASFTGATDYSGGNSISLGWALTIGYTFTVGATDITVDALGSITASPSGFTVRIYQVGQSTNVASALVTDAQWSPAAPISGRAYAYTAISPVTLFANTTYAIVLDNPVLGAFIADAAGVALDPRITFGTGVGAVGAGLFPTTDVTGSGHRGPYFGPSFEIAQAGSVPEPGTLLTLAAGLVAFAFRCRGMRG